MSLRKIIFLTLLALVALVFIRYSIPILVALLTAILLEPIVKFFQLRLRFSRVVSVTTTFVLFLAALGLGTYWLIVGVFLQAVTLAKKLPELSRELFQTVKTYLPSLQSYYESLPVETFSSIQQVLTDMESWAIKSASSLGSWLLGIVAGIPGMLIVFLIYLISVVLISLDLPGIRKRFMNLFTDSARQKVELVFSELGRATLGFLRAQVLLSALTYVLTLVGLLILGIKYAVIIAFLVVLVDILPILGTGSFLVPWATYLFFVHHDVHTAIGLVVMFVVITIVRRTIEPKVLGDSLGISALAALVSLYVGFQLIGFFGLILGPAVVIIYEALQKGGFLKFKIDF